MAVNPKRKKKLEAIELGASKVKQPPIDNTPKNVPKVPASELTPKGTGLTSAQRKLGATDQPTAQPPEPLLIRDAQTGRVTGFRDATGKVFSGLKPEILQEQVYLLCNL